MEYMKEKIDSSDIPTSYLLCMKQDCPKATTCLRRIAEQQIGDEVKLMRRFGRRTYYRVRKGERPLSPDEQKSMLNILKQCGINDPGKFDAYFEAYDW